LINRNRRGVAFFGGSFDPPHQGHSKIVSKAIECLDIDLVLVVPTYQNPLKQTSFASANQRLEWCREVFSDEKTTVSSYEIDNHIQYTAETLRYFEGIYEVRYLIIGADNLKTLKQWHDFEWLNSHIIWAIVTRGNIPLEVEALNSWVILPIADETSSTHIRTTNDVSRVDQKIAPLVKKTLEKGKNNK